MHLNTRLFKVIKVWNVLIFLLVRGLKSLVYFVILPNSFTDLPTQVAYPVWSFLFLGLVGFVFCFTLLRLGLLKEIRKSKKEETVLKRRYVHLPMALRA